MTVIKAAFRAIYQKDLVSRPHLKQEWELSLADFERSPVWLAVHGVDQSEPWYDDDDVDEATFRPWDGLLPVSPRARRFLVFATMELHNGSRFPGAVCPAASNWDAPAKPGLPRPPFTGGEHALIANLQPRIFVGDRCFSFWGGLLGVSAKERQAFFSALGQGADAVFPLRFSARPGLVDGVSSGIVHGFYRMLSADSTIIENDTIGKEAHNMLA